MRVKNNIGIRKMRGWYMHLIGTCNQSRNHSWKSFSFYWIATFKIDHSKGSGLLLLCNQAKMTLKVLSFWLNCDFLNRSIKAKRLGVALKISQNYVESPFHVHWITTFKNCHERPGWLVLWRHSQNDSWTSFSFELNCDFQKKVWKQSRNDNIESSFHFHWIATFKKGH